MSGIDERRRQDRDRQRRYRQRRRTLQGGGAVIELHLSPMVIHHFKKLGLLTDERDLAPEEVAEAVTGYLAATTAPLADMSGRFAAL